MRTFDPIGGAEIVVVGFKKRSLKDDEHSSPRTIANNRSFSDNVEEDESLEDECGTWTEVAPCINFWTKDFLSLIATMHKRIGRRAIYFSSCLRSIFSVHHSIHNAVYSDGCEHEKIVNFFEKIKENPFLVRDFLQQMNFNPIRRAFDSTVTIMNELIKDSFVVSMGIGNITVKDAAYELGNLVCSLKQLYEIVDILRIICMQEQNYEKIRPQIAQIILKLWRCFDECDASQNWLKNRLNSLSNRLQELYSFDVEELRAIQLQLPQDSLVVEQQSVYDIYALRDNIKRVLAQIEQHDPSLRDHVSSAYVTLSFIRDGYSRDTHISTLRAVQQVIEGCRQWPPLKGFLSTKQITINQHIEACLRTIDEIVLTASRCVR